MMMPWMGLLSTAVLAVQSPSTRELEPRGGGQGPAAPQRPAVAAPRTPPGLSPCLSPLVPSGGLPRGVGETVRYVVDVNGLSVGTVDFRIEKRGNFGGAPVTEYRSLFKLDSLVASVLPVEGRAAALVPDAGHAPAHAMARYRLDKNQLEEDQTWTGGGRAVSSRRLRNGKASSEARGFPGPAQDFVSAFYLLRALPSDAQGCAIVYANQRAYTIWIKPDGEEEILTPVGLRSARRYAVTYGSDKAKVLAAGRLWLSTGPDRLPYKAELLGQNRFEARIHLYETGASG